MMKFFTCRAIEKPKKSPTVAASNGKNWSIMAPSWLEKADTRLPEIVIIRGGLS